jgi:hypothetical protein
MITRSGHQLEMLLRKAHVYPSAFSKMYAHDGLINLLSSLQMVHLGDCLLYGMTLNS